MSPIIWTRCAGRSDIAPLRRTAVRVVESHHRLATRALVRSVAEHEVLEALIERVKPAQPHPQHYLLTTPFRCPPLRYGSRFGTRQEQRIWYGALALPTALAEVAYDRLLFLEGTRANIGGVLTPLLTEHTAFKALVSTTRGVDLTRSALAAARAEIASPVR
jgi:hypothetical protein